ncbi:MAG TPA: tRNA glutamyl-Q(34) synthetase GluQRS [Candidatus Acidoferrum sp.]|nr:tRNA glutamyl-Q(34) synthetase GluQRS [Candidatus Acidoferrum sp.]
MNPQSAIRNPQYRGRLAPSPTGLLHLGHARTFWVAQQRARTNGGKLILRNEDIDARRFRLEFVTQMLEDLRWFGFEWQEGPDRGGPCGPYSQSERQSFYLNALEKLRIAGFLYPCTCSRSDIRNAARAPHGEDDEVIYPGTCRGKQLSTLNSQPSTRFNWRFRVSDGEVVSFTDGNFGPQRFVAGSDFGDFVVWRHDDVPAYQLACVVDDAAMGITEVVRGADLLLSTARQLLLYRTLNLTPPRFFHCELMRDEQGKRLAKRHDALSLRALHEQGNSPEILRGGWPAG